MNRLHGRSGPRWLGALLGIALGVPLGALLAEVVDDASFAPSQAPFLYAFLGGTSAALSGWVFGSFALRRPRAGFLWLTVSTYLFGILLCPVALVVVAGAAKPTWIGQSGALAALSMYVWTPMALVLFAPILVLVVAGAFLWVRLQGFLAPKLTLHEADGTDVAVEEERDRRLQTVGIALTIVALVFVALGVLFFMNLRVGP